MICLLDLSLPAPRENLAFDERLLDAVEKAGPDAAPPETLRFWECGSSCVVLGHSGRIQDEVHVEACERAGVPVLRRISGGGTVLLGPGCLNFSLALCLRRRPELRDVRRSVALILTVIAEALRVEGIAVRGISDLAVHDKKVSGNAQRRTRDALLHHGTLLYDFDRDWMARLLKEPARQPDYRAGRSHLDFVGAIPLPVSEIKQRIAAAWCAG